MRAVSPLALLMLLAASACAPAAAPPGRPAPAADARARVRVALRVDDVFMNDTNVQPQEIDSFLAVAERHGARVEFAVIPARLVAPRNADGRMAAFLRAAVARGHAVSQHGWTHRHGPTGNTGGEFMDPATGAWEPADTVLARLRRGRALLEAVTARPVLKYVGVGTDRQMEPPSVAAIRAAGFRILTNPAVAAPMPTDSFRYVPDLTDYTWALHDSTYARTLAEAKADFARAAPTGYFAAGFHDHFTRHAWNGGIVSRWLGDLLAWMEAQPGVRVEYVTADALF